MNRTVTIHVRLPAELVERAERERLARGETQNEFIQHAVELLLVQQIAHRDIERYTQGYRDLPEDESELAGLSALASAVVAEDPWE